MDEETIIEHDDELETIANEPTSNDVVNREELKHFGIDYDMLESVGRGRPGQPWSPLWRTACEALFVAGVTPDLIERKLKGPQRAAIYEWASVGGWLAKRDEHQRKIAEKALENSMEGAVETTSRHIKALRAMQNAGMLEILKKRVVGKSLEGTTTAIISAIRAERSILGLDGGEEGQTPTTTIIDQRIQTITADLDKIPNDQRAEFFELSRQRLELDDKMRKFASSPEIVEHQKEIPNEES